MPSSRTWWWVGAGTAAALALAGGALVVYGRRRRATPQTLTFVPPTTPTGLGQTPSRTTPRSMLRAEICTQWKTGNNRPNWRPALFEEMVQTVNEIIDRRQPTWETEDDRQREAFAVARRALAQTCPDMPLPEARYQLPDFEGKHFWWDELWGRYWSLAYNGLADYGV